MSSDASLYNGLNCCTCCCNRTGKLLGRIFHNIGAPIPLTLAAIVSAASFGSHACFYSDATVITSAITKIENTEHAFSQFPYAVMAAGAAAIVYAITGFIMI